MARPLRIEYDGALYHVTSRGNARKAIFKDDEDRELFLDTLTKVNERYNWLCHAYCLMNNHYHLLIETPDGNLSKGMRHLNGIYTQRYNKRYKRTGHIFQGRYKAIIIQKESHLLAVCRYVVLNPVRARAVKHPEEWKWSSYKATAGSERSHNSLTADCILAQFEGKRRRAEREYREFVMSGIGEEKLWTKVKGQSVLGESDFVERLIGYVKKSKDIKEIPKHQRYINRPSLNELFNEKTLRQKQKRNRKMVEVVYEYGYNQKEIADHLGMHYSTISRLINRESKISRSKT
jgi:REP element-mobilizing transposase RayT